MLIVVNLHNFKVLNTFLDVFSGGLFNQFNLGLPTHKAIN